MRLILKFLKTLSSVMTSLTQNLFRKELNLYIMYQQLKRDQNHNHTIFEENNSFLRSVFEHYKILMPPHYSFPCCDVIIPKFGQERFYFIHHVQMVIKGSK